MITIKDRVLYRSQEEIFSLYFGITKEEINWSTLYNCNKLINPLRGESNASLTFKWYGDKLYSRDWGSRNYSGDVFSVVGYIINKNPNLPNEFIEICEHILETLSNKKVVVKNKIDYQLKKNLKLINEINYIPRNLNSIDYSYYNSFGIVKKQIDKYVNGVYKFDLNGFRTTYKNSKLDPCYAYNVNRDFIKLYFPYRNKNSEYPRFLTKNILPFDDLDTLTYNNDIIIVKSIKDKMLLEQLLESCNVKNIGISTISGETNTIPISILHILNNNVKYNIFSMLDIDETGINQMNFFKDEYGFIPLYFNTNAKDPTDYTKKYGYNKAMQSFKDNVSFIIDNRDKISLNIKGNTSSLPPTSGY